MDAVTEGNLCEMASDISRMVVMALRASEARGVTFRALRSSDA